MEVGKTKKRFPRSRGAARGRSPSGANAVCPQGQSGAGGAEVPLSARPSAEVGIGQGGEKIGAHAGTFQHRANTTETQAFTGIGGICRERFPHPPVLGTRNGNVLHIGRTSARQRTQPTGRTASGGCGWRVRVGISPFLS